MHEIWSHATLHKYHLWVERVPSAFHISDCPSRFDYALLEEIGASWREPVLADMFLGQCD